MSNERMLEIAIESLLENPERASDKARVATLAGREVRRFLQYRTQMRSIYLHILDAHLPAPAIRMLINALDEPSNVKRRAIWFETVPTLAEARSTWMIDKGPRVLRRLLRAHLRSKFVEPDRSVITQSVKPPIHTPDTDELLTAILNEMRLQSSAIGELLQTWKSIQEALTKKPPIQDRAGG